MFKYILITVFITYCSYECAKFWSCHTEWGEEFQNHHEFMNHNATKTIRAEFAHKKGFENLDDQFSLSEAKRTMGLWLTSFIIWTQRITVVQVIYDLRDWILGTSLLQLINPQNTWMQVITPVILALLMIYAMYCIKEWCLNASYMDVAKQTAAAKRAVRTSQNRLDNESMATRKQALGHALSRMGPSNGFEDLPVN